MNLAKNPAVLLLVMFCLVSAQTLFGQGTDLGTIRGSVTDASGAVIPNAKVVILDISTGTTRETTTNAQGEYQMFGLRPGSYKVSVSAANMRTVDLTGIVLNGSDVVGANAVLGVASQAQSVEVTAEVPTINTTDQTISETIDNRSVNELPRDSRNVYTFLYLNPNITQSGADGEFKFMGAESYGANFTLDGQRSNGGVFGEHTDGQPALEAVGDVNVLSNDFSAEFGGVANIRVTTKRGDSTYHGSIFYNNENSALGAWDQADIIGKQSFAPTPFQSNYPAPYYNLNDLGGSFGGPVPGLKKTWFFAAYERNYDVSPVSVSSTTLPHPTLYAGDFSLVDDASKPAVPADALAQMTPDEIANDTVGGLGLQFVTIPSRLLNPTVQSLIGIYFPKVGLSAPINSATGQIGGDNDVTGYHSSVSGRSTRDVGTLRLDHDFTDRDHMYAVYNGSAVAASGPFVQTPYTGLGLQQNTLRDDTLSISYTRVINDRIVNELRGGFNREDGFRHSNTTLEGFLSGIGFDQSDIDAYGAVVGASELKTHGHPAITFGRNFSIFQNGNRNTDRPANDKLATFGDTLTWVVRKHNLKMGADFVRNGAVDGFAVNRGNVRGAISYGTAKRIDPFAQFLLGEPASLNVTYVGLPRPPMEVHNWEQGFFFQDDWKVSPRLTLNLGVRYELITPFIEDRDLLANFDPNYVDPTTGNKGRFLIPSDKTRQYLDPRILSEFVVTNADQAGLGIGRGLVRTDKNNVAPRVGAAFRITDKTVLRGGYGFYYPTSAAQGIRDPIATNPFNQGLTKSTVDPANPLSPWPGFAHGFSPLTGGDVTTDFATLPSINAVPVGLQQPRVQQYNVTFEREIMRDTALRLSYLGTYQSGLIAGTDLNEIPANDIPFGTTIGDGVTACDPVDNGDCLPSAADIARQPFPGLGDYLFSYGNYGHARSDAFQTQFEHRYSRGLMLNLSYTYLSQRSTALDTENSSLGGVAYNPFHPQSDYGQESFIPHHRFVAYGIYDLPFGKGRTFGSSSPGWVDAIFGGWQTTFNMFAKSGAGFTPFWVCDDCGPISPGNVGVGSVDAVGDFNNTSFRPVITGNYNHRNGDQIWDPNAFALPLLGGDMFTNPAVAKRNQLTGPGAWGVNLGVHKNFPLGERFTAMIGVDIDNLFNHFLFSPDSDYGGGGGPFAMLGDFLLRVDPGTLALAPISPDDVTFNPDFGRLIQTFPQEGVAAQRQIRLKFRLTF
jgi:hypothetical protein